MDVALKKILIICFLHATITVKFGINFIIGSNWFLSSQLMSKITFFNSDHWVGSKKTFLMLYIRFGFLVFGLSGVTVMLEFFNKKDFPLTS